MFSAAQNVAMQFVKTAHQIQVVVQKQHFILGLGWLRLVIQIIRVKSVD